MQGNLISNFAFQIGLNLSIKLFWLFGIEVAVQNILGPETYGVFYVGFNFAFLFYIILDLGLNSYNSRTLGGNEAEIKNLFPAMLSIKIMLAVIYFLILIIASKISGHSALQYQVVLVVGMQQILVSFLTFFRSNISGMHLFRTDSILSVLDRLIMGLICVALIWLPFFNKTITIWQFLWAQSIGYFFAALIALFAVLNKGAKLYFSINKELLLSIIKKSYPLAVLFTLMTLYTRIDSIMLDWLLPDGLYHSGIYASAFRFLDASVMFAVLLGNMLLPMFSRLITQQKPVNELVSQSYRLLIIAAVILPLCTFFFGKQLYLSLYPNYGDYGVAVTQVLFFDFIPMSMGYIFGTLLTASNQVRLLNYVSFAGLAFNFILNWLLIPKYQALGATYATIATQCLVSGIIFLACTKIFYLPKKDFVNTKVIGFIVISIMSFYLLSWLNPFTWIWNMVAAILVSVSSVFVIKLINLNDWLQLLKSGK